MGEENPPLAGRTVLVAPADYRRNAPDACLRLERAGARLIENPHQRPYTREELLPIVPELHAAVVGVEQWDRELMAAAPQLRTLTKLGVGVDNIDLAEAGRRGITVTNAPGGNANAVAEFVVAGILAWLRELPRMVDAVRAGAWPRVAGRELSGMTVGLVGFGRIGRLVARRLAEFDVRIRAYDPYPDRDAAARLGVEMRELDAVLEDADIVSIHLPSLPETRNFVSEPFLAALKQGCLLVNTARGALIDEAALLRALDDGRVGGAVLDVFQQEPLAAGSPLVAHPRVLATPHGAADTREAYRAIAEINARSIIDAASGRTPDTAL